MLLDNVLKVICNSFMKVVKYVDSAQSRTYLSFKLLTTNLPSTRLVNPERELGRVSLNASSKPRVKRVSV